MTDETARILQTREEQMLSNLRVVPGGQSQEAKSAQVETKQRARLTAQAQAIRRKESRAHSARVCSFCFIGCGVGTLISLACNWPAKDAGYWVTFALVCVMAGLAYRGVER